MPATKTEQTKFIEDNFAAIYPTHLSAFAHFMTRLRAMFDGDLDLLVILTIIGERTRSENWAPELLTYRHLTVDSSKDPRQQSINVQSVADYSGIARETVRRKVAVLKKKGWVKRDPEGRLSISRDAAQDLEEATIETVAYLAGMLAAFEKVRTPDAGGGDG